MTGDQSARTHRRDSLGIATLTPTDPSSTLSEMSDTLPVTVVTGFLGAGKTTLVNRWLTNSPRGDVAVIVNEHGDVGIDGELLAARARVVIELSGGCICCTTHAALVDALDAIARSDTPPRRVLVETSGAATPAGVVRAIVGGGRSGTLRLDGVITIFDSTRVETVLQHDLAFEQLGYADVVVMSRADACSRETLRDAVARLTAQNQAALFVESGLGQSGAASELDQVLALRSTTPFAPRLLPAAATNHAYESVALSHPGEVEEEAFADFVESTLGDVAGRLFRIKGIVAISGVERRLIVQGVGDGVEVDFGEPWADSPRTTRLVVVGYGLDADELRRGFSACTLTAAP